jgi:sigma-E factor negative regulatory protein RseC
VLELNGKFSMSANQAIEHEGLIKNINGNNVLVRIVSQSACAACHAKGGCSTAEMQEKENEVTDFSGIFKVGETVNLIMKQSQGYTALLIAYIYPFLLVFTSLLITTSSGLGDLKAGLLSLAVLLPYYLIIYALKNKIRKRFIFSIRKID